jgi:hypothetical protein
MFLFAILLKQIPICLLGYISIGRSAVILLHVLQQKTRRPSHGQLLTSSSKRAPCMDGVRVQIPSPQF